MTTNDFLTWKANVLEKVEQRLDRILPSELEDPADLHRAMRYAVLGSGKRIRALLVCASARAFGGDEMGALGGASAVELIHAYSLVHDDLPCMDDDQLRRGKPTVHVEFGEAVAMLVGDALQPLAFQTLVEDDALDANDRMEQILLLSRASGSMGMVGGQYDDISQVELLSEEKNLVSMHQRKTGALIQASVFIGARYGNLFHESMVSHISTFSRAIGLGFQVIDDILDVTETSINLGKTAGKDNRDGKSTFVTIHGLDRARKIAQDLQSDANESLSHLPDNGGFLKDLTALIFDRSH
ncbi:MAG: farnesyl diphosphate synthase [Betaproteobacteria bacterium]